jgi:glucan phosphoethanolaminetransferase (alkaline phosphatase superfamily)
MPVESTITQRNNVPSIDGPATRSHLLRMHLCNVLFGLSIIVVLFSLFRCAMLFSFGDFSVLSDRSREVARMLNHGLRYDIRTATIALAPFTLIGLILITWPKGALTYIKFFRYIPTTIFLVALIAAICNYFYYATYGSYFDVFIFGLFEEDTKAVLSSIRNDYPIFPALFFILLTVFFLNKYAAKTTRRLVARSWQQWPVWRDILVLLLFLTGYSFGVHGSFGRYPLERRDAQVSSLKVLNMLTPNAVMALDWAISDHKKEQKYPKAGDKEGQALFSAFYHKQVPLEQISLNQFAARTPKNAYLEAHPPHVVFAVMESLSSHLMSLDDLPANDMLGAWRPYWQRDFTFSRFLSDGNGTMESLARLLVASPVSSISQYSDAL